MTSTAHERADLMSKLGLDAQNTASLGRVLGTGNIGQATERADGRMQAQLRIPPDELIWDPSILVMPHGGDIDLEIINDDKNTHCALFPSNGDRKFIWLVNHSKDGRPSTSTARAITGSAHPPATTKAGGSPEPSSCWGMFRRRLASTAHLAAAVDRRRK